MHVKVISGMSTLGVLRHFIQVAHSLGLVDVIWYAPITWEAAVTCGSFMVSLSNAKVNIMAIHASAAGLQVVKRKLP